ncbi:MAG: hypothetical protein ACUVTW_14215 [Thermogutta sp.]
MVDSMRRCRVFAITPRAGSRNHRYLIPPGASWPERELGELAARAYRKPDGGDYVAIARTVNQPSTGRKAKEMLILTDGGLKELNASARKVLFEKLGEYGERLEHLVTREIDWEKVGDPLVVENVRLEQWQRELTLVVEKLLQQWTASTARTAEEDNSTPVSDSPFPKLTVSLAILTLFAAVLAHVWPIQCWDKLKACLAPNKGRVSTGNDQKSFTPEQSCEKYFIDLVDWGDSPPDNDEKRRKALDVVYLWYYEKEPATDWQTRRNDAKDVLAKLRVIREVGEEYQRESEERFDPLGLLEKSEDCKEMGLDQIDPGKLRCAFRELEKLWELARMCQGEGLGKGTAPGKVFEELDNIFKNKNIRQPEGPQPKFFVQKDVYRARMLKEFLASNAWRTFCSINEKSDDLPGLFAMMKQHREELGVKWQNRPGGDDAKINEWYAQLEKFVDKCAAASPESGR